MTEASARQVAADVLVRVWRDDAFAAAALSRALDASNLERRDRALATELSYGVLRTEGYLERRLRAFGKLKSQDWPLRAYLLVGVYQLDFLPSVPARAVVHQAVELVRRDPRLGARQGGFVNAVLRRASETPSEQRLSRRQAVWASTPSWLKKRAARAVGSDEAQALLAPESTPALTLRWSPRAAPPELPPGAVESVDWCPGAYRWLAGGDPRALPDYEQGRFVVQELGAQAVAHALALEPGQAALDVCAGRGQKATLLADRAPGATVVATDLYEHKLSSLEQEAQRNSAANLRTARHDWTQPPPDEWKGYFDRVLVDAPCTGSGTLRRRPEILRRLTSQDPARLAELQKTILRNAAEALKPGGVLLFATCSVLPDEGEAVVQGVREILRPRSFLKSLSIFSDTLSELRLRPLAHGTDGYFVACLEHAAV